MWTTSGCKVGNCLSFSSGSNVYVRVPNNTSFNFGSGSYTISAWINTPDSTYYDIVGVGDNDTAAWRALTYPWGNHNIWLFAGDGNTSYPLGPLLPLNTFVHVVFGYNATAGKVFYALNGVYSSTTATNIPVSSAKSLTIGSDSYGNVHLFVGTMDDVRIYNRALSAAEVMALYNATK